MYYIFEDSESLRHFDFILLIADNFSNMNEGQAKQSSLGVLSASFTDYLDQRPL